MPGSARPIRVLTVSSGLPLALLDAILTAAETALLAQGASRVWLAVGERPLTVMAEFDAAELAEVARDRAFVGEERT
jgi:hypothetical protein